MRIYSTAVASLFLALAPFISANLQGSEGQEEDVTSSFTSGGNFSTAQSNRVTLFDHDNYQGDSIQPRILSDGACTNVLEFNDRTSSVKIDEGCVRLWQNIDCKGGTLDVLAPGEPDLTPLDFNDNVTSISSCDDPCVSFKEDVEIVFHLHGANDLASHSESVKKVMEQWFPFIQGQLFTPAYKGTKRIDVHYEDTEEESHYTVGNNIYVSQKRIRKNRNARGLFIHEMTHVIHQAKSPCPKWVYEGTAEYMRDWFYYPMRSRTKPTNERFTNPWYGDWLLAYLNTVMQEPLFYEITKACQEGSWTRNWLMDRTGKDENQWWRQMVRDKNFPWKRLKN